VTISPPELELARHVIARLERLSADSHWAYHASGLRRSLLTCLDDIELGNPARARRASLRLDGLVKQGFTILERAAREIGDRKL
jgi:hypothetical protein